MTADLHAEQAVLGAVLLNARTLDQVRTLLAPDDFHRGAHRSIYEALVHLAADGKPIDAVTLTDELARRGHLESVGGTPFVASLQSTTPTASTGVHYARIVADLSARRRLAEVCDEAGKAAVDLTVPLDEARLLLADLPATRSGRVRCLSSRELETLPPPEWLIDGVLPAGLSVLYGPSGSGKSFVALDWAWSLCANRRWLGHDVSRRRVLYVAGEGHSGLKARREAWMADRAAGTDGWYCVPDPINMLDPSDVETVAGFVADTEAGLLVLDTLARTMLGNENETETMVRYVAACDRLRARHGCSVLVVHHTGVDATRMRGNQSLFAAADCVVRVEQEHGQVVVSQPAPPAGKAKDAPHFEPFYLRLKPVEESVVLSTGIRMRGPSGFTVGEPEPEPEPQGREFAW